MTTSVLSVLGHDFTTPVSQASTARHLTQWIAFETQVDAALQLTEPTRWQRLDGATEAIEFHGHLIGGCLDAIAWLAGTRFGDVPAFVQRAGLHGAVLFLENAEMSPPGLVRALWSPRRHGWFDGLAGLMIGRSAGPDAASSDRLCYVEALHAVLDDLPVPVIFDVDIGHRPPQFTLINGAWAQVRFAGGGGSVTQAAQAWACSAARSRWQAFPAAIYS